MTNIHDIIVKSTTTGDYSTRFDISMKCNKNKNDLGQFSYTTAHEHHNNNKHLNIIFTRYKLLFYRLKLVLYEHSYCNNKKKNIYG